MHLRWDRIAIIAATVAFWAVVVMVMSGCTSKPLEYYPDDKRIVQDDIQCILHPESIFCKDE